MSDRSTSLYKRILSYEKQNREVAEIIAADPRYRDSALAEWASLILRRGRPETAGSARGGCGSAGAAASRGRSDSGTVHSPARMSWRMGPCPCGSGGGGAGCDLGFLRLRGPWLRKWNSMAALYRVAVAVEGRR
jgi:hypothetical protein